jgi:hypothetical protein
MSMASERAKRPVMEEHLPLVVKHHLRGPQAGRATIHAQEDMVGLFPIEDRGEPLGQAQPVPAHTFVDGHAKLEAGEVNGDALGR